MPQSLEASLPESECWDTSKDFEDFMFTFPRDNDFELIRESHAD